MFNAIAKKIFGSRNERVIGRMQPTVDEINALGDDFKKLSDKELKAKTNEFRERLDKGTKLDDLMIEAFATVREAADRALGERHYDVQLMGGMVLHQGRIAEMKTGEGKTLVSTLPVYLNALEGKGVHVVTVNDYLAKRDAEWMMPVFEKLGINVRYIQNDMDDQDRRDAYQADVTYGTNNEFGFDYLRDNMKFRREDMVQRPFNYVIIDEVDSILIDEARTPLIISGPTQDFAHVYQMIDKFIPSLKDDHYEIDEKLKVVNLTDDGVEAIEKELKKAKIMDGGSLYDMENITLVHHVNMSLRAHKLFQREKDYIVNEGKIVIIDEFTGRMMPGRRYGEGLHQAIEAKEGVEIQRENQTLASITFQNYFRLYPKIAGMTGTAITEEEEFMEIYSLDAVAIPTNKPIAREDNDDEIYRTDVEKSATILNLVKECQERGQPVLVGTTSIDKSERLSALFKHSGVKHHVLNAKQHEREAYIVAQAGQIGAVTIATNMAGRGTDIKLGGNTEMILSERLEGDESKEEINKLRTEIRKQVREDRQKVMDAGGLYVIGTERHESRRIDNQLRGRSGRQGDPGASKFFLSLEDDLMRIFGADRIDGVLQKLGIEEGQAITHAWINKAVERAQKRVEAQHFDARKNLLKFDDVMNDQRKVVYEQRQEIMESEDVSETIDSMRHELIENMVINAIPPGTYAEQWNIDGLKTEVHSVLDLDIPLDEWAKEEGVAEDQIIDRLIDMTDKKTMEKEERFGKETMQEVEKMVLLQILDQLWKDHLHSLDHLRQGISLRAVGQKDPLNEYKAEAFAMFEGMLGQLREGVVQTLARVEVRAETNLGELQERQALDEENMQQVRSDQVNSAQQAGSPVRQMNPDDPSTWGKVSRNAECPCGSGKKYKRCHGAIK